MLFSQLPAGPPVAVLHAYNMKVLNMLPLFDHNIRVTYRWEFDDCDATIFHVLEQLVEPSNYEPGTFNPFLFSHKHNKFVGIGCNVLTSITHITGNMNYTHGCASFCKNNETAGDTSYHSHLCSGCGCCQTTIPVGIKSFLIRINSINTGFVPWYPDFCSRAFLINRDSSVVLASQREIPLMMSWVIGNSTCKTFLNTKHSSISNYACGNNAYCANYAGGYQCQCSLGYKGNPYLTDGCQDIDECTESKLMVCELRAVCTNTKGGFYCRCPFGYHGEGTDRNPCIHDERKYPVPALIGIGVGLCLAIIIVIYVGLWCVWKLQRINEVRQREKFFKQNGGLLLQQQIASSLEGAVEKTKIFVFEDLERATDNFNESRIRGKGGFGTVYKGMLPDGRIVAIKKSQKVDENQVAQFINEVVILSQINHRHIVKLLGCCLETQVPLLVYEFIDNGTLSQHLHGDEGYVKSSVSWDQRLRIATEIAGALAYLHSAASAPIFHRDVKSSNILLDNKYVAKVSDFGLSRTIPIDKTHFTTQVLGTFGYLDPEYFHSGKLTEKSDVYSFGVVLIELLTGKRVISSFRSDEDNSLVMIFISAVKANRVFEIMESRVLIEGKREELWAFAKLAKRCVKMIGKKRPRMKEIAADLDRLRRFSDI